MYSQAIEPGVLQLAAATAFLVAAKVEEEDPPTTSELMSLCDHAYDRAKFKHMEFIMLDQGSSEGSTVPFLNTKCLVQ